MNLPSRWKEIIIFPIAPKEKISRPNKDKTEIDQAVIAPKKIKVSIFVCLCVRSIHAPFIVSFPA